MFWLVRLTLNAKKSYILVGVALTTYTQFLYLPGKFKKLKDRVI